MTVCLRAWRAAGSPSSLVLSPPSHPPLHRALGNPELAQTASIPPLSLWRRAWHVGLVRGRVRGRRETGRGAAAPLTAFLWPRPGGRLPWARRPQLLPFSGGVGSASPAVLCPAAPCGVGRCPGHQGVGRRTSPRSTKACGILGLLGQRYSDVAELRLGQEQIGGGGCQLN